jgi:hypothetical protein
MDHRVKPGGDALGFSGLVTEIAWTACQRLDALQDAWRSLCKIAARAR